MDTSNSKGKKSVATATATADKAVKVGKSDKADKMDKTAKSDRAEKVEKGLKADKAASRQEKVEADPVIPTDHEHFSKEELAQFRKVLEEERVIVLAKAKEALNSGSIKIDTNEMMDDVDLATATVDQNLTFRLLDRDRKLLSAIEKALEKLDTGEFGYCEGTGELIPKRRLELRPWCKYSVKYKEQLEKAKKSGRGVADEEEF